jgi:hypothetical protein
LLNVQILALSLIPLLSGIVPDDRTIVSPAHLLGVEDRVTDEFLIGTWKYSEDFFRWGLADKEKAKIKPFKGNAYMRMERDGTIKMVNLFRPSEARWELTGEGILIHDPKYPDRNSQVLPVKKRDKDRIWVMLPFAGGATGIGMVRVPDEELSSTDPKTEKAPEKRRRSYDRTRASVPRTRTDTGVSVPDASPLVTPSSSRDQEF